jgi:hypothetical protein
VAACVLLLFAGRAKGSGRTWFELRSWSYESCDIKRKLPNNGVVFAA